MKKTRKRYPINFNDPSYIMRMLRKMLIESKGKDETLSPLPLLGRQGQIYI